MSKKQKSTPDSDLTKAERKALKQKEAALVAELEARAAKAVKPKSKNKSKGHAGPDLSTLKRKALKTLVADRTNGDLRKAAKAELAKRGVVILPGLTPPVDEAKPVKPVKPKREPAAERPDPVAILAATDKFLSEPAAGVAGDETHSPAAIIEAADKVLTDPGATMGALKSAQAAKAKALEAMSPAELKARVKDKAERRAALEATADSIDRDDAAAVEVYNLTLANLGGGHFITSNAEREVQVKRLAGDAPPKDEPVIQVIDKVETETGHVFEAGAADADEEPAVDFGKPSEAPQPLTLEEGRNGYKIMMLKADGTPDPKTVRQFTRVTTYIDNLEDKTNLERWKMRTLLEGVALTDTPDDRGRVDEPVVARVRELMHTRDVALTKAIKADRKGKLETGELGKIEAAAIKAFKDALNVMASDLLELGGVHEKANRGTNLHALTELYDAEGIEPIDAKLAAEEITPTDHASIVAYGEAMAAAGVKVVASEVVIVNDRLKYAGRFDRTVMAKRPGDTRASRVIADIKSGRLDYGLAKVEQQLAMYADGEAYDLETGERTPHGATKSWGLVIHLPQGEGTCTIHVLDLNRGRKANALSAQVRAHRTEAGRMKLGPDLAKPETTEAS